MTVYLAGGGTGGHLYPGIAVAEKLAESGIQVHFLVSDRGIERKILEKTPYPFTEQKVTAVMGKGIGQKMRSLVGILRQSLAVRKMLKKGDKVLLLGGFAAAPAAFAGATKGGVSLYLHEQNSVMGRTNKLFARFCRKVFLSFDDTLYAPAGAAVTGNPVRKVFAECTPKQSAGKHILVIGGSQGSRIINRLVAEAAPVLLEKGYTIRHQCGGALRDETAAMYGELLLHERVQVMPYIDDVAAAMQECDVIIGRSGAGSVFEAMYAKRPALFIPFAQAADNHQYRNALSSSRKGIAIVITEKDATAKAVVDAVEELNARFDTVQAALKTITFRNTADEIAKDMLHE